MDKSCPSSFSSILPKRFNFYGLVQPHAPHFGAKYSVAARLSRAPEVSCLAGSSSPTGGGVVEVLLLPIGPLLLATRALPRRRRVYGPGRRNDYGVKDQEEEIQDI